MGDFNKIEGISYLPLSEREGDCFMMRSRVRNIVKAQYEDWLEYTARRHVFNFRSEMTSQEFKESMDAVARQCAAGTFAWGGDACNISFLQMPGQVKFIKLLVDDADALRQEQDKTCMKQNVDEAKIMEVLESDLGMPLAAMVAEIRTTTPNFRAPPVRGRTD